MHLSALLQQQRKKPAPAQVDSNADAATSSRKLALYSPGNLTSPRINPSQRRLMEIGFKRGFDLAQISERLRRLDGFTQFSSEGVYVPTREGRFLSDTTALVMRVTPRISSLSLLAAGFSAGTGQSFARWLRLLSVHIMEKRNV